MSTLVLHIPCALLFSASFATGVVLSNVTLDDANGNIMYRPSGSWSVGFGQWDVNTAHLFNGTWHHTLSSQGENQSPSIEVQFTGVAVYVYNVIIDPAIIQFQLDNESPTIYPVLGGSGVQYNALVYSNYGLENRSHTLTVTMALNNDGISALFFDRLVITVQQEEQIVKPTSSNGQLPIITTPSKSLPQGSPSSSDLSLSSSLGSTAPSPPSSVHSRISSSSLSSPIPPSQTQPTVPLTKRAEFAIGGALVGGVAVTLLIIGISTILCRRRARPTRERAGRSRESFSPILEFSDASGAPEIPPTYTSLARAHSACPSKNPFVLGSPTSAVCAVPFTPSQPSAVYDGPTDTPSESEYETPSHHPSSVVLSPEYSRGERSSSMPHTLPFAPDGQSVQQATIDPGSPEHEPVVHEDDGNDDMISTQVRARFIALELELQRLRLKQQEMHSVLHDAPPRYEET